MLGSVMKPMISCVIDIAQAVEKGVNKDIQGVMKEVFEAVIDVPEMVKNWDQLKPELEKVLADPTYNAELLAFAIAELGGTDEKAKAVIVASADLVLVNAQKIAALVVAIKAA